MLDIERLIADLAGRGVEFKVLRGQFCGPYVAWFSPPHCKCPTLLEQNVLLRHAEEALRIVEDIV